MKTAARGLLASMVLTLFGTENMHAGEFRTGVDMNFALEMERAGKMWTVDGKKADVFRIMARAGCDAIRVRLWLGDEGENGLKEATETARRAQAAGLKPYVVIFLSDDWADSVKQPRPAVWKDLDEPSLLQAVEAYAARVTRHFAEAGIAVDTFGIGNEIDFGICGIFEKEWPKRVDFGYMTERIWSRMAPIIAAAQRGVRAVKPDAKFILHATLWDNTEHCLAFWRAMLGRGVQVDFAGLSYFPTASPHEERRTLEFMASQVTAIGTELKIPVVICETGFPTRSSFGGGFSDWNKAVPGYPLNEEGQRLWIADWLRTMRASGHVAAAYYWSPEWSAAEIWEPFAVFDSRGEAREGLKGFANARPRRPGSSSGRSKRGK